MAKAKTTNKSNTASNEVSTDVTLLKKKLFDIKFNRHTTGIQKPHEMKNLKKEMARKLTKLNEQKKNNK